MLKGSNYEGKIKMSTRGTDYAMKQSKPESAVQGNYFKARKER